MMNCPPLLYLILDFEKYCLCVLGQLLTTIRQDKMDRRRPSFPPVFTIHSFSTLIKCSVIEMSAAASKDMKFFYSMNSDRNMQVNAWLKLRRFYN